MRAYPETASIGGGGITAVAREEPMPGKPIGGVSTSRGITDNARGATIMGSPFASARAYLDATGTLHSFTGHPVTVAVFVILSLAVTGWFLVRSFTIHH